MKLSRLFVLGAALGSLFTAGNAVFAQGSAFTYQGQLQSNGSPASGTYNLTFSLFEVASGGSAVAGPITNTAIMLNSNGLFTTTIDFGSSVWNGATNWLQIGVETNGGNTFTALAPRQQVTPTPQSIYAINAGTAAIAATSTNFAGVVSGDVSGTQGATVVATVGGQTAANIAAGVLAANSATSSNVPDTIVARDGSGSFAAANVTVNGALYLPSVGITYCGSNVVWMEAGSLYIGNNGVVTPNVGADTRHNTGVGDSALNNEANNSSLTGSYNTACGEGALGNNSIGAKNTASGFEALYSNSGGFDNTACGYQALYSNIGDTGSGFDNTANGFWALYANSGGSNNTANGAWALTYNTDGSYNTASGYQALLENTSGAVNIALGFYAGFNLTTGSQNIDIGNAGSASDAKTIRIGVSNVQTATYIAGINGATVSGGSAVYVDGNGHLGTLTSSRRFKDDIQGMADTSEVLYKLQPVTFRYKPGIDPQGTPQFGLVAEEVEKVDPGLVVHDGQGQPYTVRYEAVNAMVLNEFLKEHGKVEKQAAEIREQHTQIADLAARLEKLEQLLNGKNGGGQ